jgi:hypothetical protein
MKLADMIANHHESSRTEEQLNNLRTSGNAKSVFDCLDFNYSEKCYSNDADSIMKFVGIYSEGFVLDIAKRFSDPSNKYPMSDKQRWCIAFAFIKINQTLSYKKL